MTVIDVDRGTDERRWREWDEMGSWPSLALSGWRDRRVVVLAAHPDDEVLAIGGTLALLARRGVQITFVWATHGEASHPGSIAAAKLDLARLRIVETRAALARLGVGGDEVWLGLPDSGLSQRYPDLAGAVRTLHKPGDVWFAPFRGDGHPDHEACGSAAAEVRGDLVEMPIWAWHWATPGDPRIPWERARTIALPADVLECKVAAIAEFRSQVAPIGPDPCDGPVLPARVVDHFHRDTEVVFT